MDRRAVVSCLLLCGLVAAAPFARAGVNVEVANGQTVLGTFDPADETETLRVAVPAGARLSVQLQGKKQKGGAGKPAVDFKVLDDGDTDISDGLVNVRKSSAKLKNLLITETGVYRIVVEGDGSTVGDYQFKASWKSQKKFTEDVDLSEGTKVVAFAIDAGARCDFQVAASKGSAAEPTLDSVEFGADSVHAFTPPAPGSKKHTEKKIVLADSGDHTLVVSSGAATGFAEVTVKVKPPKTDKKSKVELTSKSLGAGDAFGTVVGPGGGSFAVGGAGALSGAAVDIPPGALGKPTAIIIAAGIEIGEVPGADTDPGGPPVYFGPEGIEFVGNASITLPFDPDLFDDEGDVQVAVRNANGVVVLVPASSVTVDLDAGTVTVIVAHFSTYQVVGPAGLARPPVRGDLNGDRFADIVFATGSAEAGGTAKDKVQVFFGGDPLPASTPSTSGVTFTQESGGDLFGAAIAVGDVSGDGQDDLVIGARDANGNDGRVYVFFGGAGFTGSSAPLTDADVVLTGRLGERFGGSVVIGDVVGDSTPDLIASSFGSSPDNFPGVHVFAGGPALTTGDTGGASVALTSTHAFTTFTARAAGDVNDDGRADLVTANFNTGSNDALHVWFGGAALAAAPSQNQTAADVTFTDGSGGGNIGREGVVLGDVIGDGTLDVIAMAPTYLSGVIHVFAGGTGISSKNATVAAAAITRSTGSFGNGRLVAGNLDGVGKDELVFADEEDSVTGFRRGLAFVFRGTDLTASTTELDAIRTIAGTEEQARLGAYAAGGDFDDDGLFDLFLAAPNSNRGGIDVGRVYVLRGRSNLASLPDDTAADMIITGQAGEFLGSQLFGAGKR